jgi:hypothetical protein
LPPAGASMNARTGQIGRRRSHLTPSSQPTTRCSAWLRESNCGPCGAAVNS